MNEFTEKVIAVCSDTANILVEKSESYGDSVFDPVRIFSRVTAEEALLVRIDDKLSRIARGHEFFGDDTLQDLLGYLVLLKIMRKQ